MQAVFRMVLLKVMRENHIDVLVHPNIGLPQWKIGVDREPVVDDRYGAGYAITDTLGVPEVSIPAGFNDIVYDPHYELSADKKSYRLVAGKDRGRLNHPMPYGLLFWAGPGDEAAVLKTASAYEAASHHRAAPPAFGPVPAQ
jgi:Asp-tRNA(Asn)/Glu-tRNA(Gln) amidotransferase A subunit family amidase